MPKKTVKNEADLKNSKKKGKGGKAAGFGAIITGLILALLALLNRIGLGPDLGFGKGKVTGNESSVSSSQTVEESAATETTQEETEGETEAPAPVYVEVKVSGGTIVYNGEEASADDIVSAAMSAGDDAIVRITDDDATQNAMEALKTVLDNKGINYIISE